MVIDDGDVEHIAGLAVTTPVRTVVDLARNSLSFDDEELEVIGTLMRIDRFGLEECRAVLDRRRNLPHKTLAVERISEAVRRIESVQRPPGSAATRFSGPKLNCP